MHINTIHAQISHAKSELLNWTNIAGFINNHSPAEFIGHLGHGKALKALSDYQLLSYEDADFEDIHQYIASLRHTPQCNILQAINAILHSEISLQGYCQQIMHGKWNGRSHEIIKIAYNINQDSRARLDININLYDEIHASYQQTDTRPMVKRIGLEIANEMDLKQSLTPYFSKGYPPIINLLDMQAHACAWYGVLVIRHLQNAERLTAGYVHLCREGLADLNDIRNQHLKQNIFLSVKLAADTFKMMEKADPAHYQDNTPLVHNGVKHSPALVLN